MKRKISLLILSSIVVFNFSTSFSVSASEIENSNTSLAYSNEVVTENDRFIRIEDDKGITIIDKYLLNNVYNENDSENEPKIMSRMANYKVKDKKYLGQYVDYNKALKTISGNSGVELNLGYSKSVEASVSTTFGVSKSDISDEVGFNVSTSYTVSHSGTYTVPSNVRRATLTAHPLYDKYEYGIYLRGKLGQPDVKMKTGYALKPIGIHYEKKLIR